MTTVPQVLQLRVVLQRERMGLEKRVQLVEQTAMVRDKCACPEDGVTVAHHLVGGQTPEKGGQLLYVALLEQCLAHTPNLLEKPF